VKRLNAWSAQIWGVLDKSKIVVPGEEMKQCWLLVTGCWLLVACAKLMDI
jgi:hypothetical protein